MAGDEVRMKVGEEDVADLEAKFVGIVQVLLDIALGSTMMAVELSSSPSRYEAWARQPK